MAGLNFESDSGFASRGVVCSSGIIEGQDLELEWDDGWGRNGDPGAVDWENMLGHAGSQ